jgi:hypothetical protein
MYTPKYIFQVLNCRPLTTKPYRLKQDISHISHFKFELIHFGFQPTISYQLFTN